MMNKRFALVFAMIAAMLFSVTAAAGAFAQSRPFQASLTPDLAVYPSSTMIKGLSINLWGENPQHGLAIGIANGSTGKSAGFSAGLLLNYADSYKGVHWAAVNYTKQDFLGWQGGFINYTENYIKGVQTGFVNYAGRFKGVQLGLINFAESADAGLQIGIVNVITANTWFHEFPNAVAPGMILVNWRF